MRRGTLRLELGSGDRPTEGFTTLDIRDDVGADRVDDAAVLFSIRDDSCEEIRACHLLEHFSWRDTQAVLDVWRRKLTPGGRIHIEVPNLEGHVLAWQATRSTDEQFVEYLYGSQDYPENTHRTAFTARTLHDALMFADFDHIEIHDLGLVLVATARR